MSRLVVVHDVLGTLFSLTAPIEELKNIFADQLEQQSSPPILAELIIMDWYHAAQRDFTNLSINDAYQPIGSVFKATLPRILLQAGLVPPNQYNDKEKFANLSLTKAGSYLKLPGNDEPFDSLLIDRIMSSLERLQPRPGMIEAFTKVYQNQELLHETIEKVELWGATNGGLILSEKLFRAALGDDLRILTGSDTTSNSKGKELGEEIKLFSCDEIKVAKPDPKVYQAIRTKIDGGKWKDKTSLWFVASHTWDLFAARKQGFKTAWVGYEEFFTCSSIYGKPDIIAADLEEAARQILSYEESHR